MRPKAIKQIPWQLYRRCEECGAEPKSACRTPDDDVAGDVCQGRALVSQLPRRAREAMGTTTIDPMSALDAIAERLEGPPPDGLRAALARLGEVAAIVNATGRRARKEES